MTHVNLNMWRLIIFCFIVSVIEAGEMNESIVIVGAGLSGFSAAARLIEKGFTKVTVLEAENRIGGRIHSIEYDDGKIDLGAQWCHGQGKNVIYEMVEETFDFGTTPFITVPPTFLSSDGTTPDQEVCTNLWRLFYGFVGNEDEDMEAFEGTLGDYVLGKISEVLKTPEFNDVDPHLVELAKKDVEKMANGFFASKSWHEVSAKLNGEAEESDGNQYLTWKKSGFVTAFDYIAKKKTSHPLDVESKIQLNKKVTKIDYSGNEVQVKTADGHEYSADHVIVTASLGVLKKNHKSLFMPNLPDEKIKAIEKNAFGVVGKIFIEFDEPFWPLDGSVFVSYAFLWNEEQRAEVKAANKKWLLNIAGFFKVDQYPKLLEGFLSGENMSVFEGISDEKLIDDCVWLFEKFLSKPIARPKLITRTKWLSNENFLGAYSFLSMDAHKFKVGPKELAKSINDGESKPTVLFAGEATDFAFPSYAHGAVSSGYRAADEIVDFYGKLNDE